MRSFLLMLILMGISFGSAHAQRMQQIKPWLGIAIAEHEKGVLINQALSDTPAQKAGLQRGDVVTAVDKTPVKNPKELIETIQSKGVGHTVDVHFLREDKPLKKSITLVSKPDALSLLKSKMLNQPAPDFDLEVIGSKASGKLSSYKGQVVILEFWATWCPACLSTHGRLNQIAKNHQGKIAVLAITDEEKPVVEAFAKQKPHEFTILRDGESVTRKDWIFTSIPALAVIDQKGIIRHVGLGAGIYLEETIQVAQKLSSAK